MRKTKRLSGVFDNAGKHHAYEALTPDVVLDALSDLGLEVDGRLTALSSYENRVYQAMLDDNSSVVAKFYRPERWSDAQILEEHSFAVELMAEEVPLVGPLNLHGNTLHHAHGFAFSVSPRRGGRMPELDDAEVLEWVGRFIARIHNVGAQQKFKSRPTLDVNSFAIDSRDWLIEQRIIPMDQQSEWLPCAIKLSTSHKKNSPPILRSKSACMATVIPAIFCGRPQSCRTVAHTLLTLTMPAWGQPFKTCGCCSVVNARNARSSSRCC